LQVHCGAGFTAEIGFLFDVRNVSKHNARESSDGVAASNYQNYRKDSGKSIHNTRVGMVYLHANLEGCE
jgi:hypothetical protein